MQSTYHVQHMQVTKNTRDVVALLRPAGYSLGQYCVLGVEDKGTRRCGPIVQIATARSRVGESYFKIFL